MILGSNQVLGHVYPPWAKDATGRNLATRYTIEGATLVQTTDTSNAAYPVVVDPKISFGRYIYVRFDPTERRELANAIAGAGGAVVGAALCARAGAIAAGVCSIVGTGVAIVVFQVAYNSRANRPHCGLEVRVTYAAFLDGWRLIQGNSANNC